jgi:hypothetical protein
LRAGGKKPVFGRIAIATGASAERRFAATRRPALSSRAKKRRKPFDLDGGRPALVVTQCPREFSKMLVSS